jgi:hypothetical protein
MLTNSSVFVATKLKRKTISVNFVDTRPVRSAVIKLKNSNRGVNNLQNMVRYVTFAIKSS